MKILLVELNITAVRIITKIILELIMVVVKVVLMIMIFDIAES